ncbi:hypothetical protein ACET3Z_009158 [Daucus carota]
MSSKSDVKGFYRQKKKSGGITKPAAGKSAKASPSLPKHAATFGSNVVQPPALVTHGGALDLKENYDGSEEVLRQFDMNMAYGPCIGMSRVARWERASKLGLNPPGDVGMLLKSGKVGGESLWDGRV